MCATGNNFALQGELIGPGIQGNIYKMSRLDFYVFDVFNITDGGYMNPAARQAAVKAMGLNHVPVLENKFQLNATMDELLQKAEGKSVMGVVGCEREGLVFKNVNGGMTFKAISNKYLIGQK